VETFSSTSVLMGVGGFTIWFNSKVGFLRRGDAPAPAELLDLDSDEFEISHSPLHFLLLSSSARTMRDEASVVPSGPLVVPSATLLLLLTSVERTIVMIAIPKIVLSLLVAETATALVPSKIVPAVLATREVSAVVLLTGGRFLFAFIDPDLLVRPHGCCFAYHHGLCVQRLLDWRWRGYVVRQGGLCLEKGRGHRVRRRRWELRGLLETPGATLKPCTFRRRLLELLGTLAWEVGFGGDEVVGENKAVSVELEEAVVAAGIAERVEVQGREERKVGAGRRLVVGIGNTVARGGGGRLGHWWWVWGLVGLLVTLVLLLLLPVGLVTTITVVRVQSGLFSGRTRWLGWLRRVPLRVVSSGTRLLSVTVVCGSGPVRRIIRLGRVLRGRTRR
jgi:hypothetical protein